MECTLVAARTVFRDILARDPDHPLARANFDRIDHITAAAAAAKPDSAHSAAACRAKVKARQQHSAANKAAPLAAQNTAAKPCAWLSAPPATPPITPDAP